MCVCVCSLTEVEGHRGVVVRFPVSDEVDLMLPLLLLQPVFCATVVTHTAAAQDEDDRPHQPEPCREERHRSSATQDMSRFKSPSTTINLQLVHWMMPNLRMEEKITNAAEKTHTALHNVEAKEPCAAQQ